MRLALLSLISLAAIEVSPASALSCMPPNFADDFNRAAEAEELYSLVYGTMDPVEAIDADAMEAEFRLTGRRLGRREFRAEETLRVNVARSCAGEFCAPFPPSGTPMLTLIEHMKDGSFLLEIAPCSGVVHLNPTLGRVSAIRACMRAGKCGPDEHEAFDLTR